MKDNIMIHIRNHKWKREVLRGLTSVRCKSTCNIALNNMI